MIARAYGAVCVAAFLLTGCGKKEEVQVAPAAPPAPAKPPVVFVAEAQTMAVPVMGEAIAKLEGSGSTPVGSNVSGFLIKQVYLDGALVKKGDLLFLIDAKLPSGPVKITAPVDGVAESAFPGIGDAVAPGTMLATIDEVEQMRADFVLKGKVATQLENDYRQNKVEQVDDPPSVDLILADGTIYPQKGRLFFAEKTEPDEKGVQTAYAIFPNPDRVLRPGEYAKVRGVPQETGELVKIPQQSVLQSAGTDMVEVVGVDNTVELRKVTTRNRDGADWVVTSGLKAGERVIVEGIDQVEAGVVVSPEAYAAPASK